MEEKPMSKLGRILVAAGCLACPANASLGARTNAQEAVSWTKTAEIGMRPVSNRIQYMRMLLEIDSIQGDLLRMGNHSQDYLKSCQDQPATCNRDAAIFYSRVQAEVLSILPVAQIWAGQAGKKLFDSSIEEPDLQELRQKLTAAADALIQVNRDYDRGASLEQTNKLNG
jgi:hypothetical protein